MSAPKDDVIPFYERNVENWKRERKCSLFEKPWLKRFLSSVPQGGTILDMGCGFGRPVADYFIQQGYHVTGIDSSPSMIAACKADYPDQNWLVHDMRTLDLSDRFDGILAWDSFFHLDKTDQANMFPVFARHAKQGAPLMFTAGPCHSEVVNHLWDAPLFHASLDLNEYQTLMKENGFEMRRHILEDPDCDFHSVYLARKI